MQSLYLLIYLLLDTGKYAQKLIDYIFICVWYTSEVTVNLFLSAYTPVSIYYIILL